MTSCPIGTCILMLISGKYLKFNAMLIFYDKGVKMPFKQPVAPIE